MAQALYGRNGLAERHPVDVLRVTFVDRFRPPRTTGTDFKNEAKNPIAAATPATERKKSGWKSLQTRTRSAQTEGLTTMLSVEIMFFPILYFTQILVAAR
jgi:hypothetical protein